MFLRHLRANCQAEPYQHRQPRLLAANADGQAVASRQFVIVRAHQVGAIAVRRRVPVAHVDRLHWVRNVSNPEITVSDVGKGAFQRDIFDLAASQGQSAGHTGLAGLRDIDHGEAGVVAGVDIVAVVSRDSKGPHPPAQVPRRMEGHILLLMQAVRRDRCATL